MPGAAAHHAVTKAQPSAAKLRGPRDGDDSRLDLGEAGASVVRSIRGCSSAVERQLPKLNVVGSIPITRSSFAPRLGRANARNTFLLLRLRRQMLVGFEDASKSSPNRARPRKLMCER
jgi:hypothetical protein